MIKLKPAFLSLLFAAAAPLWGKQFIITYEATSKNSVLINETYYVSDAMTRLPVRYIKDTCQVEAKSKDLKTALKLAKNGVLDCLFKNGVRLRGYDEFKGDVVASRATLFIQPTRIEADFKEDFVKIDLINQQ